MDILNGKVHGGLGELEVPWERQSLVIGLSCPPFPSQTGDKESSTEAYLGGE